MKGRPLHKDLLFPFKIEFWTTKHKVVACVAAALKPLLSVAKTYLRLSGRKLYAGNIDDLFWNFLTRISSCQHKKVRPNRERTEKCVSIVATQFSTNQDTLHHLLSGNRIFAKSSISK